MKLFASILAALTLACASGAFVSALAEPQTPRTTHVQTPTPEASQGDARLEVKQTTVTDDIGDAREYQTAPGSAATGAPFVTTADINVRSAPATTFPVVAVLPRGTTVGVIGNSGSWLHIAQGWVSRSYLRPITDSPRPASTSARIMPRVGLAGPATGNQRAIQPNQTENLRVGQVTSAACLAQCDAAYDRCMAHPERVAPGVSLSMVCWASKQSCVALCPAN